MALVVTCLLLGCNDTERRAERLTSKTAVKALGLRGDAVDAGPGDIVMRSSKAIAVIQRPLREMSATPYGGNLVDFASAEDRIDRFGELQPFLNMGRTANFTSLQIVNDGSNGGAAIVEATGTDALFDFVNVPAIRPDLLSYNEDGSGFLHWDPNAPIPVSYSVRYTLPEDSDVLTIAYTVKNESEAPLGLQAGVSLDQGGAVDFFVHERGFGGSIGGLTLEAFTSPVPASKFFAIASDDVTYGIRPIGEKSGRPLRGVGLVIAGFAVILTTEGTLFDVVSAPNFTIDAKASRTYAYAVTLGRTLADVRGKYLVQDKEPHVTISGSVSNLISRLPSADYAFFLRDSKVEAAVPLDEDSRFSAVLPPGTYDILIDTPSLKPIGVGPVDVQEDADFTIDAGKYGHVAISAPAATSLDSTETTSRPCRVTIFSSVAATPLRTTPTRAIASNAFDVRYLRQCETDLLLQEGTYLIQVSAGPSFDVISERVVVQENAPINVTGTLHRIFSTSVASDFHQHSINSPDSNVPLELRALGYAAEGVDFFASSDHDHITDYTPVIASLGLQDLLATAPGIETTTFAFGHFNAWPLPADPTLPNGGSIDWGREAETLLPRDIFKAMRDRGAAIVQVNHPRGTDGQDFQSFFDRAALVVDPDAQILGSDPLLQPVSNTLLRLPEGEPLFDRNFDAIELLNGFNFSDTNGDGRADEYRADVTLRDFMGFVAQGFHPTLVGVSDSHSAYRSLIGYPRTYVQSEINDAESIAAALKAGRAVASNSPMLRVRAVGLTSGEIGSLVSSDGTLTLEITSEAQTAAQIDRFEIFVNEWTRSPELKSDGSRNIASTPATQTLDVAASPVVRGNGGTVYMATASVPLAITKDAFIVVRASGKDPLFPLVLTGNGTPNPAATSAGDFFSSRRGAPAIAVSNPVYVDRDGDGVFHPPALP